MFLLQYFKYDHLPVHLQKISAPFCDLAYGMAKRLPDNPETEMMLQKIMEAKDCAVRSALAETD